MHKQSKSATITPKNASILMFFFYSPAATIDATIQVKASESQIDTVKQK